MFTNLCVDAVIQLTNGQTHSHFFVRASEHLGITPLTGKFVKVHTKSAIFDHMLLDGHKARFDNFWIHLRGKKCI